jgi:hypothetical protein
MADRTYCKGSVGKANRSARGCTASASQAGPLGREMSIKHKRLIVWGNYKV